MEKDSIYDTGKALIEDSAITTSLKASYLKDDFLKGIDIHIVTKDGVVTLSGELASNEDINKAIKIAKGIEGVKDVTSNLEVTELN